MYKSVLGKINKLQKKKSFTFFREFIERHLLERESQNKKKIQTDYDKLFLLFSLRRKVWRYQRGNHNPYTKENRQHKYTNEKMSCVIHSIT